MGGGGEGGRGGGGGGGGDSIPRAYQMTIDGVHIPTLVGWDGALLMGMSLELAF